MEFTIAEWTADHPQWKALQALIEEAGQASWVNFAAGWHLSSHMLVAHAAGEPAGFLRFVVQPIGPDMECAPLQLGGEELREAKVLAFGVAERWRRQGLGRALQLEAIRRARTAGCFQVRSRSGSGHPANHQLKLGLGFAGHPVHDARGEGVYFLLPLRPG